MELEPGNTTESDQCAEPALSSPQPPPYTSIVSYACTGPATPRMSSMYAIIEECPSFPPPSYEEAMGDSSSSVLVNTSSSGVQAAAEYAEKKLVKRHPTGFADESHAVPLMCAFCETEPVEWKDCPATECKGQAWCDVCNSRWHTRNPKRKEHKPIKIGKREAKSPSSDPFNVPGTEAPVSHQDDLHLTSTQQSAAAMSAPQVSPAASAAPLLENYPLLSTWPISGMLQHQWQPS